MSTLRIPLHSRKYSNMYVVVDENDVDLVNQYRWYPRLSGRVFYAQGRDGKKNILMHRLILMAPHGVGVDHINGDGLDNRRCNLRFCNQSQNNANRKYKDPTATSKYRGVTWEPRHERWYARIKAYGVSYYLGEYRSEEDAAQAWDAKALELFGEFANLNCPYDKEGG